MKAHEFILEVWESMKKADAEERCSQRYFLHIPCCLLPLRKILNMHFPKLAVLRDTWAEYKTISDVFIMPYDVTVCVFISWITSKMAHELCVFWLNLNLCKRSCKSIDVCFPCYLVVSEENYKIIPRLICCKSSVRCNK